jgi:putative copper export protein
MNLILALFLLAIVACLAAAVCFVLRKPDAEGDARSRQRLAWTLTLRVALSVTLFVCLLLAWKLGYIQPNGWRGLRG